MIKVKPFPALPRLFPLIFLSNFSNTDEVVLVANLSKTSLAKGIARSNNYLYKFSLLNDFRQSSLTKIYICRHVVKKSISCFSFCIVFRNNSCGNSSS